MAANAQFPTESISSSPTSGLLFTPQQLDQLVKLMPQLQTGSLRDSEADDEIDHHFLGMITHTATLGISTIWIIDSGVSDHMTSHLSNLINPKCLTEVQKINFPTGDTRILTHCGIVCLTPDLVLKKVLCVPHFKHNLLFMQRLSKDGNCEVQFFSTHCHIVDSTTKLIKAIGMAKNGLFYLDRAKSTSLPVQANSAVMNNTTGTSSNPSPLSHQLALWHHRFGHASLAKLKHIPCVKPFTLDKSQICITCPMSKFAKLSFSESQSHASMPFELIHIDI